MSEIRASFRDALDDNAGMQMEVEIGVSQNGPFYSPVIRIVGDDVPDFHSERQAAGELLRLLERLASDLRSHYFKNG